MQLVELQGRLDEFRSLDAEVIAISTDTPEQAAAMVARNNLEFPVLYDTDTAVTRAWGVFDLLGDGVAAPATFVFDVTGTLRGWRIGRNSADRPSADEVIALLKEAARAGDAAATPNTRASPAPARPTAFPTWDTR